MAAAKWTKGINVVIGGETVGLSKALSAVNKESSTLQKELKEVDKALKLDPTNVMMLAQKQDLLGQSAKVTESKLKALKTAQADVDKQFEENKIDATAYRDYQRELSHTESALKELETQQETTEKAMVSSIDKISKVASKITVGGIKTVGEIAKGATKGLEIYAGAALTAGTAVLGLAVKAGASADDLNTMSAQTGLTVEQLQKFQYASEVIDVPIETLASSMAKLTRNMSTAKKGTGDSADAFKKLKVDIVNVDGTLKNNNDVFNETIKKLGEVENQTERDALAMAIFGKSAQDLNPLILGGASALDTLGQSAQDMGLILSQEALDSLNELNDSIDILKANTVASGNVLAGVFSDSIKTVTDVIGGELPKIAKSIAEIFENPNSEEAKNTLSESVLSIVQTTLATLTDNLPKFLTTFNSVILSIVGGVIKTLPSTIKTIMPVLIKGMTDLLNGLIEMLPYVIQSGMEFILALMESIAQALPQLIETAVSMIPQIVEALTNNLPQILTAGIAIIVELAKGLPLAIPELIATIPEIIFAIIDAFTKMDWLQVGVDIIAGIGEGLWNGIVSLVEGIPKMAEGILNGFKNIFQIHSPSKVFADQIGKYMADGIDVGFADEMQDVNVRMGKAIAPKPKAIQMQSGANNTDIGMTEQVIMNAISKALANSKILLNATLSVESNVDAFASILAPKIKQIYINQGVL